MGNNLKKLRKGVGLSKKQIAEKVGATELQIQRIESNKYPAPLGMALAISTALETPIDRLFPGATKALAALDADSTGPNYSQARSFEAMRKVGLEVDIRQHHLKVLLRGHQEAMFFRLLVHDVDRIFSAVQGEEAGSSFVVFDTDRLRVALNLKATMFCQFLWDASGPVVGVPSLPDIAPDEGELSEPVQIYFAENPVPLTLGVEAEPGDDIESENNYLNNIFGMLDEGLQPHERLHIVDEDGEGAFIRVGDLTLLTAPLWVLDPNESVWEEDD